MKIYCLKEGWITGAECENCYFRKVNKRLKGFYCDVSKEWKRCKMIKNTQYSPRIEEECKNCYVEAYVFLKKRRF